MLCRLYSYLIHATQLIAWTVTVHERGHEMYSILCVKVKLQEIEMCTIEPLHKAHHSQTRVKSVAVSLSRNVAYCRR